MYKALFSTLLVIVFCSTAAADLYVNIGFGPESESSWPKAPYLVKPDTTSDVPGWMPSEFYTFCVERWVTYSPNPGDYLATVDEDILYGGDATLASLDAASDPLFDKTRQIYAAFLNDKLEVAGVAIDGNIIQESIWGAQGYKKSDGVSYTIDSTIAGIITGTDAIAGWNNVEVLNLWSGTTAYTGDVQSQLVMTPVPGAFLLGIVGLSAVGVKLRKHA